MTKLKVVEPDLYPVATNGHTTEMNGATSVLVPSAVATKRIALFGLAPSTRDLVPAREDFAGERWTLNDGHVFAHYGSCDRWFDLHPSAWWRDPNRRGGNHVAFLQSFPGRVYLQELAADVPGGEVYPKETILERFGYRYFTSTIAWMLALAITELGAGDELWLWGVDLAGDTEYATQRPSTEWLLGWAMGAGIRVHIPEACPLLRAPLYAFFDDEEPGRRLIRVQMENEEAALQKQANEHNQAALIIQGRLQEIARLKTLVASG